MILAVRVVMGGKKKEKRMERDGRAGTDGVLSVSLWFGFFLFIFSDALWVGVGGLWIV